MVQKISISQYRNKLRQAQNKQKQAIAKYNRDVTQHNQKVNRAINQYNTEVRKHNARVRANRQKIASELRRIQSNRTTIRYQIIRTSAISLNTQYEHLDSRENEFLNTEYGSRFLDLSEKENANSLETSNILESEDSTSQIDPSLLLKTEIGNILETLSSDLNNRWKGALFSLNPNNPDAARHFCTSAREVFIQILDINAPDEHVINLDVNCEKTERGQPTRRAKIKYLLHKAGILSSVAVDFVDEDVKNVLSLFRVFNDGTHGSSGKFGIDKLMAIKTRVENGISYLSSISTNA
jgi:predicted pPIWI-associating nuclease